MISAHSTSLAVDSRALDGLRSQARNDPPTALRAAAKQLESVFLGMMLKSMREASWEDPYFGSSENKLYTEMLDKQLTQSMTEGRGLGLADAIYRQLSSRIGIVSDKQAGRENAPLPFPPVPASQGDLGASSALRPEEPTATPSGPRGDWGAVRPESPAQFIQRLWPHAEKIARELNIPAHFLLGHAALESGWGRREIAMPDGSASYNLFGIKAGEGWMGASTTIMTTEYQNGTPRLQQASFRAYGSYEEAFRDYGRLLLRRYPLAVSSGSDTELFAKGLARGGYATDPLYADKLQRVINSAAMRHALQASDQV